MTPPSLPLSFVVLAAGAGARARARRELPGCAIAVTPVRAAHVAPGDRGLAQQSDTTVHCRAKPSNESGAVRYEGVADHRTPRVEVAACARHRRLKLIELAHLAEACEQAPGHAAEHQCRMRMAIREQLGRRGHVPVLPERHCVLLRKLRWAAIACLPNEIHFPQGKPAVLALCTVLAEWGGGAADNKRLCKNHFSGLRSIHCPIGISHVPPQPGGIVVCGAPPSRSTSTMHRANKWLC